MSTTLLTFSLMEGRGLSYSLEFVLAYVYFNQLRPEWLGARFQAYHLKGIATFCLEERGSDTVQKVQDQDYPQAKRNAKRQC